MIECHSISLNVALPSANSPVGARCESRANERTRVPERPKGSTLGLFDAKAEHPFEHGPSVGAVRWRCHLYKAG
jgi:hypothetical protein